MDAKGWRRDPCGALRSPGIPGHGHLRAGDFEEIGGHPGPWDQSGLTWTRQVRGRAAEGCEPFEGAAPAAPGLEDLYRRTGWRSQRRDFLLHDDQQFRVPVRQLPPQAGLGDAEDGGVGPYTQGQGEERGDRDAWILEQTAHGEAYVQPEGLHPPRGCSRGSRLRHRRDSGGIRSGKSVVYGSLRGESFDNRQGPRISSRYGPVPQRYVPPPERYGPVPLRYGGVP